MIHNLYLNLIRDLPAPAETGGVAAEPASAYQVLTEKHLQVVWFEQKHFHPLHTIEGQPITVLSPGIWNCEAGPDFLKAHLRIGDQEYRGDVELHLSEESWYSHKHHLNAAYNRVVLHLSYWSTKNRKPLLTASQREVACVQLEPFLSVPEPQLFKLIDLELYPYHHFSGSGRCSQALFNQQDEKQSLRFFRSAAAWRLIQKKERLQEQVQLCMHAPQDPLKVGIASCLGYKHNSEAFLNLFSLLNRASCRDETSLLAMALSVCGFFSPYYQQKWQDSVYYKALLYHQEQQLPSIPLRLDKIRPANHPVRRLALLVKLVCAGNFTDLLEQMHLYWQNAWPQGNAESWPKTVRKFLSLLPQFEDAYWESHFTFEAESQKSATALMGETLKQEIFTNICLPLIYAPILSRNSPTELHAFHEFYASLPAPKTRKAAYLSQRFFGDSQKATLICQADTQQGAYQLHRDFCIHYEASCEGCSFVEHYHKFFF
jgi:hypothetical protein